MPAPSPITNFQAFAHPLGLEIEMVWTMPSTLPAEWKVYVFRREGSDISSSEIDSLFAGTIIDDITRYVFDSTTYPDITGFSDYLIEPQKQYYYQSVLQDVSDDAVSTEDGDNATEKKTVNSKIIDAKAFVLTLVERVMTSYGMVKDEHYQLLREYALPGMKAPVLYVTRVGGNVLHHFIGHFRDLSAEAKAIYGEIEMDTIQVVWEDPNAIRRDNLTNVFRESKEFIRQYLEHPSGAGMTSVDIVIEGDVINEAVRDRVQVGGMMMISCIIESEASMSENLASWLEGEGIPTE